MTILIELIALIMSLFNLDMTKTREELPAAVNHVPIERYITSDSGEIADALISSDNCRYYYIDDEALIDIASLQAELGSPRLKYLIELNNETKGDWKQKKGLSKAAIQKIDNAVGDSAEIMIKCYSWKTYVVDMWYAEDGRNLVPIWGEMKWRYTRTE